MALFAIIALAVIGCKGEDNPATTEQPQKQPNTTRTLSFGTAENPCAVTIKSDEQFTAAEWKTLCDKVVAAIQSEYARGGNGIHQIRFEGRFESTNNISVVLLPNSATWKCEVKEDSYTTIYLRIDAIDTANLQKAVEALSQTKTYQEGA